MTTLTITAQTDITALVGNTYIATRTVRGTSHATTVRITSAVHTAALAQVSALVVEVETNRGTGMALEYGDARLTPVSGDRCPQHPAFEPDNCPRCGTAHACPPVPAPAAGFYDQGGRWVAQGTPNGCVDCSLTFATPAEVVDHARTEHQCEDYPEDPAYLAWLEEQDARGPLAGVPVTIGCYECGGFDGVTAPEQTVLALGPVVNAADPTQTYKLACGHLAM